MIDYQKILNKNLLNVFVDILKEIEKNGLDGNNHLYISFKTIQIVYVISAMVFICLSSFFDGL